MHPIIRRLPGPTVGLALTIALAACGGSSSSQSNAATSPGGSSTTNGATLSDSTPVSAPQFRAKLVAIFVQQRVTTESQASPVADCVIKGLPAIGITTRGAFDSSSNAAKEQTLINSCIKRVTGK